MRTTKAQISLRIRAVWSAPLLFICSIIPLVSISELSSLYLASVAEPAVLSLPWSQTPKTGFLATRLTFVCCHWTHITVLIIVSNKQKNVRTGGVWKCAFATPSLGKLFKTIPFALFTWKWVNPLISAQEICPFFNNCIKTRSKCLKFAHPFSNVWLRASEAIM